MASIRERILAKVVTVIEAAVPTVAVVRSPMEPLARGCAMAVVVDWLGEQYTSIIYDRHEVEHALRIYVVARDAAAEQAADDLLVTVHAALMADRTMGGLALDTLIVSATKQRDDLDQAVCAIGHEYKIIYRVISGDLALQ